MTVKQIPDYDLEEMIVVTAPGQLRALADPLRGMLLDLLLERAATVTELALAVDRPKSTVAYHVNLLVDAGLLRVVRTRRVRAIEERYYGRVARTIYIGALHRDEDKQIVSSINGLAQAAAEAAPAHAIDDLRCTLVHARIPREEVRNFWAAVLELSRQFAQIPRAGDQVYGFAAGLYPTDAPTLPDRADGPADLRPPDLGGGAQLRAGLGFGFGERGHPPTLTPAGRGRRRQDRSYSRRPARTRCSRWGSRGAESASSLMRTRSAPARSSSSTRVTPRDTLQCAESSATDWVPTAARS
jgi:DNA-binding transcriptional ArsR family regulator